MKPVYYSAGKRPLRVQKLFWLEYPEEIDAEKALVTGALLLCRPSGRVNYADALTNADARAYRVGKLYTFEERFPSEGLALERPR